MLNYFLQFTANLKNNILSMYPTLAVNFAVQRLEVLYQLFILGQRGTQGGLLIKCHNDVNLYIYTMKRGALASQ